MPQHDDNDRVRDGSLPNDPFEDTEPVNTPPLRGKAEDTPAAPALDPLPPFKAMGELGRWLDDQPPPRRWLLKTNPQGQERPEGMLPLEVVGMLAAQGAGGKTWAAIQLALSVATGRPWLDTYSVNEPGNVLLALGEEPEEEVRWRLFHAAQEMGLTEAEKALAATRLFPMALSGRQVALTLAADSATEQQSSLPETPVAIALRQKLEGRDWKLIIVDPLSRFAGPDVELDNAQATRFVQVLETFTKASGTPTVLFAHHTGKAARKDSDLGAAATAARGASGLTDAVRWQANLVPAKKLPEDIYAASEPRHLWLTVTKTNRAPEGADLRLVRGKHGVLRPATSMETATYEKAAAEDKARRAKQKKAANANVQPRTDGKFSADKPSGNGADATGTERLFE
jgi:RecA-family ATPase